MEKQHNQVQNDEDNQCCICYNLPESKGIEICKKHIVCIGCMMDMFDYNNFNCPMCRVDKFDFMIDFLIENTSQNDF